MKPGVIKKRKKKRNIVLVFYYRNKRDWGHRYLYGLENLVAIISIYVIIYIYNIT